MLRINDIEVIPINVDFSEAQTIEEYVKAPKPKPDYCQWLVDMGYVRFAPVKPEEKRKPKPTN